MNTLRILGIAALLTCVFFKLMHWPGANALALLGFILAMAATFGTLWKHGARVLRHHGYKPAMAVLLYGAGLMHMLTYPGGTVIFHTMVVVTIVFLLSSERAMARLVYRMGGA